MKPLQKNIPNAETDVTAPTILVVDDRAINLEYLAVLFHSKGYRTLRANDGAEALEILRIEKIALVVSDVLMPVMDGIELADRMHADPAIARIPLIFYTATYRTTEARVLAQRCGAAMVLAKPSEAKVILDAVATVLEQLGERSNWKQAPDHASSTPTEIEGLQHQLQAAMRSLPQSQVETGAPSTSSEHPYSPEHIQSLTLRTAALLELSMALALEHEPQQLLDLFCRAVQDIMSTRVAAVGLYGGGAFNRVAQRGMSEAETSAISSFLDPQAATQHNLLTDGLLRNAASLHCDPAVGGLPEDHPLRRNCLLAPIILRSHRYGWLYVADKLGTGNFSGEDEQFAATLAVQVAPAYENMALYDEARQRAGELELEIDERRRVAEHLKESETRFRQLAENIHEVFFLSDENVTHALYVSPTYEEVWGDSLENVYAEPRSWIKFIHPDDRESALRGHATYDEAGRFDVTYRIVRPDGQIRSIRSRGFPVRDESGKIYRFAGIAEDITLQVAQSRRIERMSRNYAMLSGVNSAITRIHHRVDLFRETCRIAVTVGEFNMAWVGVIDPDTLDGEVIAWYGGEEKQVKHIKLTARPGTPESDRPSCTALREKRPVVSNDIENDPSLQSIVAILRQHGHRSMGAWPLVVGDRAVAVLGLSAQEANFFDAEQVALLDELADDLAFGLQFISKTETESRLATRLSTTFESITDAFIMLDRNWKFTNLNSVAERMLACPRNEVLGTSIWDWFPEAVGGKFYQEYHKAVLQNCSVAFEEYYGPLDLWVEIRAFPSDEGLAIYFADIGERKAAEAEIHELAFFDKLTSLPNRQLLLNRLEHAMSACKRAKRAGAVLFIDLDNFKSINDTRGHDKGDMLLRHVAIRLKAAVRGCDTVARIGGDEYVILLENLGSTNDEVALNAKRVAETVIGSFREPFDIAGQQEYSACSIGVAIFDQETASYDDVLKGADLAMYQAKAAGRNAMSFFSIEMQARITKRVALESDLRTALDRHEFLLHYQPQINIDGNMVGVEALVRWKNAQRGLVSPADFIPIAEDTGLIIPLGRWVMKTACDLLAKWAKLPKTESLTIAVNVSAQQFRRPDFVAEVMTVLEETGVNPNRLKLELTESLLVNDIEGTVLKMNALKQAGILFSLDDFGTGYSSLSYLHRLPLDQLKIDQSFIRDALRDDNAAVIARTVLALGKALNLNVIAEGVETAAHHAFIRDEGCLQYQGYLFSKPLPEAELEVFITNNNTESRAP